MNKIKNIEAFREVDFEDLKELKLKSNSITDIKIFEKVCFRKLEVLNLESNKIDEKQ